MKQELGKTENAPIVKVGHTFGNAYGSEPMSKERGVGAGTPTPQDFKGA